MIIVVGSHSRKIGKTSIICSILRGTPELAWTAVKISANRRGISGGFESAVETAPEEGSDTARYLAAGAAEAHWLRAADERMDRAAAYVNELAGEGRGLIVESNRIVEHLRPDLYWLALDYSVEDFKDSARRLFPRADAYLHVHSGVAAPRWAGVPLDLLRQRPIYPVARSDFRPRGAVRDLRGLLGLPLGRSAVA